jgi:DNA-binding MarR family transcriptional regulator
MYHFGMPRPAIPPATLLQMPTYALSLLGREAHDRMAAALPDGLRLGHLAVLGVLADEAPRAQRALADALRIHPSDVVTIVDDLVARDLASRETDPKDRRRNLVRPTTAGRQLVRRATRDSQRISRELLAALSAEQRTIVEELLRQAVCEAGPDAQAMA